MLKPASDGLRIEAQADEPSVRLWSPMVHWTCPRNLREFRDFPPMNATFVVSRWLECIANNFTYICIDMSNYLVHAYVSYIWIASATNLIRSWSKKCIDGFPPEALEDFQRFHTALQSEHKTQLDYWFVFFAADGHRIHSKLAVETWLTPLTLRKNCSEPFPYFHHIDPKLAWTSRKVIGENWHGLIFKSRHRGWCS